MFDRDAAHAAFVRGLSPQKRSTQSWDIEGWSASWRGADDGLRPGSLGLRGGAWWFRALTDPERLAGRFEGASEEPLSAAVVRANLSAFIDAANQVLVHWPRAALAPVAFPLREALGPSEALHAIVESIGVGHASGFVRWLGPLEPDEAARLMTSVIDPAVIAALAIHGRCFELGIELLGASELAEEVARQAPDLVFVKWAVDASSVPRDALARARHADSASFAAIARKLLSRRDREVWNRVAERPVAELVPDVIRRLDDAVAPWVIRFLRNSDDDVLDTLLRLTEGRSAQAGFALRALTYIDQTALLTRIDSLEPARREDLRKALTPSFNHLPELPRSDWKPWMTTVSQRSFESPDWLDLDSLPALATQDGFRIPRSMRHGLLALLAEVEFDLSGEGRAGDRYDSALDALHGWLDPSSANAFWNSLFAMWWTNHQPDVRWVVYAAAFICDGSAIRDLGAKLKRHKTWFGHLSPRVIAALGHSPTAWSIAALDDIARRSRNSSHRDLASRFLQGRANVQGVTIDRLVESNFPSDADPLLDELAASRLEEAMCEGRVWSTFTWRELLRSEPFARIAPAVLWRIENSWGEVAFARLDGGELVDAQDDPVLPEEDDWISVAHPAEVADPEFDGWSARFADYELVQPFEQLERLRFRAASLSRDGYASPTGLRLGGRELLAVAGARGWSPVTSGAHGDIVGITRAFPQLEVTVHVDFPDRLEKDGRGESALGSAVFRAIDGTALPAVEASAVAFSEAYRDLTAFTAILTSGDNP